MPKLEPWPPLYDLDLWPTMISIILSFDTTFCDSNNDITYVERQFLIQVIVLVYQKQILHIYIIIIAGQFHTTKRNCNNPPPQPKHTCFKQATHKLLGKNIRKKHYPLKKSWPGHLWSKINMPIQKRHKQVSYNLFGWWMVFQAIKNSEL